LLPAPSCPTMLTTTPTRGVCAEFETTVRPRKDVVGAVTAREAVADCETGKPSTVAAAETVRVAVEIAWLEGAVSVRTDVCPAVMLVGLKEAVTPLGRPFTVSGASWLKPLLLASCTE